MEKMKAAIRQFVVLLKHEIGVEQAIAFLAGIIQELESEV